MARFKVLKRDFTDYGIHEQRGADPTNVLVDLGLINPGNVCAEHTNQNDHDWVVWNYAKNNILYYLIDVDKAVNT